MMKLIKPLEMMIAWRYFRARKKEGVMSAIVLLSFMGISLGVAALIVVMAVMTGFRVELTNKILGFGGHITVSGFEQPLIGYKPLATMIEEVPRVKRATPIIQGQLMIQSKWGSAGSLLKGVAVNDLKMNPLIAKNILYGSLDDMIGTDTVMLGSRLAEQLNVTVGSEVTLISPKTTATAIGPIPRMKKYSVAAVFETGMYEYDVSTVMMPLDSAQLLQRMQNTASAIEIMIDEADYVMPVSSDIMKKTKGLYRIRNWQMDNMSLVHALEIEQVVMFFILTIIVIVAAFNIVSSLIMLVNDKRNDIAILRSMGMSKAGVIKIFFICGGFIGIIGTVLGLLLGLLVASNIETIQSWLSSVLGHQLVNPVVYFLSQLPAVVEWSNVLMVSIMSLSISLLATLYPAWKASKLDPVEALRYE